MAEHAGRDGIAASARRTHGCAELDIHEFSHRELLAVVPAAVVEPLADDLDRWLRSVLLEHGHVEIVDEDDGAGSLLGTEDPFLALVKLVVNYILNSYRVQLDGKNLIMTLNTSLFNFTAESLKSPHFVDLDGDDDADFVFLEEFTIEETHSTKNLTYN